MGRLRRSSVPLHAALLAVCAVVALVAPVGADLTLQTLPAAAYPTAVCTDGTRAGYYWKPATDPASAHLWLVYLQGGGWCYDPSSCGARCGSPAHPKTSSSLCSSAQWGPTMAVSGLFWPANDTLLQGANKAYVRYCTSDGHMGDAGASAATAGWHFRGHAVVRAVITELVTTHGLGESSAAGGAVDTMIFGGGSAGARGGMVHLDYVPHMLQEAGAAPGSVNVVGFLDSPLWIDLPPFPGSGFVGFDATTQGVFAWANVTNLGPECAALYPGDQGWRCLFGQYRMPTVHTPYLLIASQDDAFQLGTNFGGPPTSAAELAYAATFANRTRALVESLRADWPPAAASSDCVGAVCQNAVFSWACFNHDTCCTPAGFNDYQAAGVTMSTALKVFMGWQPCAGGGEAQGVASGASCPRAWVDTCDGFQCGAGCSLR